MNSTERVVACTMCTKTFSSISNKNKHIRIVHHQTVENNRRSHIICPLCKVQLGTYINLKGHLQQKHEISLIEITLDFSSTEDYESWKKKQRVEVSYALMRKCKKSKWTEIHYTCNRSNTKGYESNYKIRSEKAGGSIKIKGYCPARLVVKIFEKGAVRIEFQKTHVGHDQELRCQHLSQLEKEVIVDKLRLGVTADRILKDSREFVGDNLERINLLNSKDISYLNSKYNIQNRTVIKAHKKANAMKNAGVAVTEIMFGHYQVKSSNDEKVYNISYSELCESECRTLFCRVCKICVHRYTCECPEYVVKHTICKHVHLVRMFEEGVGANSVLDSVAENLNIKKESEIKNYQQQEIDNFIENKRNKTEEIIDCTNKKTLRQVWKEDFCNFIDSLEDDVFTNFTGIINKVRSKIETSNDTNVNKKRKMETQAYFPRKKSC